MECDRYEVLYKIVRIANSTALDFTQGCRAILRVLGQSCQLRSLAFLLYDSRRKKFTQTIRHPDEDGLQPLVPSAADSHELRTLRARETFRQADRWYFPVYDGRQNYGVLVLQTSSGRDLPEDYPAVLRIVCEELARLMQFERLQAAERQRIGQLTLLSELGRELNRAGKLRELTSVIARTILRQANAACVILRPLYGGAVFGGIEMQVAPEANEFRELFLALEDEHSAAAMKNHQPLFRHLPRHFVQKARTFPPEMVLIPLLQQGERLGVLSVFGDSEGGISFSVGTETRRFFTAIGTQVAHALERAWGQERLESLSEENDRKLRETSLLYRISRAIHSTLRLNELMHLVLSSAVAPAGGGFERAMLFTVNPRSNTLQGMLCVNRDTYTLVLPEADSWEKPTVTPEALQAQRDSAAFRRVVKLRLSLDQDDNPLARAIALGKIVFINRPGETGAGDGGATLAKAMRLGPYVCAPLFGRDRPLGVLLIDNAISGEPIAPDRRRFLELFAAQAGSAMENSMLLHRLETAHQDLRETQDKLIQGEKMALLGEMAASIAHELRNPLVPIGGFAQRLARLVPPDSREAEYTDIITREVKRMEGMLSNILAFSKKQMLCFGECRVSDVVENALQLEKDALARAAILVVKEIAADLPVIQADQPRLCQVLINLIANARQAMPEGGTLTLRAHLSTLRGADAVAIEVEDSGGGISAEVLHNMFNPFFSTKEGGTGLGLSISHRIIAHHRGEVEVKNTRLGVLFRLRLPLVPG